MGLTEFIKKYKGKTIDFDGYYGGQCVDLYRQYCKEVLNFAQNPLVVGACDIWDNFIESNFTAIKNTPKGLPKPGDIMIWGKGIGKYGHVGIFLDGDLNTFSSFDQNFPSGSPCKIVKHNYKHLIGWLTPWCTPI
jgi:hypothetical protein